MNTAISYSKSTNYIFVDHVQVLRAFRKKKHLSITNE